MRYQRSATAETFPSRWWVLSMHIGRVTAHTSPLCGKKSMIPERLRTDRSAEPWNRRTRSSETRLKKRGMKKSE